jgi:hypothetical protein
MMRPRLDLRTAPDRHRDCPAAAAYFAKQTLPDPNAPHLHCSDLRRPARRGLLSGDEPPEADGHRIKTLSETKGCCLLAVTA